MPRIAWAYLRSGIRRTSVPRTSRWSGPCEAEEPTTKPPNPVAIVLARSTTSSNSLLGTESVTDAVWMTRGPSEGSELSRSAAGWATTSSPSEAPSSATASPLFALVTAAPCSAESSSPAQAASARSRAARAKAIQCLRIVSSSGVGCLDTSDGAKVPARGRLRLRHRTPRPLQRDGRPVRRAQRGLPRLVRDRPDRLPGAVPGRLQGARRAGDRRDDDGGPRPLPGRRALRRRPSPPRARLGRARGPFPVRLRHREDERSAGHGRRRMDEARVRGRTDPAADPHARLARRGNRRGGRALAAPVRGRRRRLVLLLLFLGRRRRRLRFRQRLGAHPDEPRLGAVARRPGFLVEDLVALVDGTRDAHGRRRHAVVVDGALADVQGRIGGALDLGRSGFLERARLAHDVALRPGAEQPDDDPALVVLRCKDQPPSGVVPELEVDVRVVHGRVAAEGVAGDVETVRGTTCDLQARLPGGVEDGRGHLRDAPADAELVLAVHDHGRQPEAALLGARAYALVEGEGRPRLDHGAVEERDRPLEVLNAIGGSRVEGG